MLTTLLAAVNFSEVIENMGISILYAVLGIAALIAGYLVFDKINPLDFNKEIGENKNIAVAIVVGSFLVALGIIIAHVVA